MFMLDSFKTKSKGVSTQETDVLITTGSFPNTNMKVV